MKAVFIDNLHDPLKAHRKHMPFLDGWEFVHINPPFIKSAQDYNNFLTSLTLWKSFKCEWVLIIQHDSGILRKGIEEFLDLDHDYYGAPWGKNAPWARKDRAGGNGGISLRKVEPHIRLLEKKKYFPKDGNEDVFFTHNLPNVAPYEVCKRFSVETQFELGTFAYHAIDKYFPNYHKILNQYG